MTSFSAPIGAISYVKLITHDSSPIIYVCTSISFLKQSEVMLAVDPSPVVFVCDLRVCTNTTP